MKNRSHFCDEEQLNEIGGYLDLGMEEEALSLIGDTLAKKQISPDEFNNCVFALLQVHDPKPWTRAIEAAYDRLQKPLKDEIRANMVNYYFSVGDSEKAFEFFPTGGRIRFFDFWVMMQVCLELGHLDEAKKIAQHCRRVLAAAEEDFTKASMIDALAAYYLRIGDCESALKLWSEAPTEAAFQRQRLTGIIKARLLQALQAAKAGLAAVAASQQDPDLSTEIPLPGNTATLMSDTERELKYLQHALEKLVPETAEPNRVRATVR
jgi:tetratricopeptide (TPR) repeat protein